VLQIDENIFATLRGRKVDNRGCGLAVALLVALMALLASSAQPQTVQTAATVTPLNIQLATAAPRGGGCPNTSATCTQLTCEQAYACLRVGKGGLDRDNDGVPCESICPGG
jgi:hypothetical protein